MSILYSIYKQPMLMQSSWYLGLAMLVASMAIPTLLAMGIAYAKRHWQAFSIGGMLPAILLCRSMLQSLCYRFDVSIKNAQYVEAFDLSYLLNERNQFAAMSLATILMGLLAIALWRFVFSKNASRA